MKSRIAALAIILITVRLAGLWGEGTEPVLKSQEGHSLGLQCLAASPDGKYILSGSSDHTARLWSLESGKELRTLAAGKQTVASVCFSPDGKAALTSSEDGYFTIWDLASGSKLARRKGAALEAPRAIFSPDGKAILHIDDDIDKGERRYRLRILDRAADFRVVKDLPHPYRVTDFVYSPKGDLIASGADDEIVRLWDARSGKKLRELHGHQNAIRSLSFSRDGSRLLSASPDEVISWDVRRGAKLWSFSETRSIRTAAFCPDETKALVYSYGSAALVDAATGRSLETFKTEMLAFGPRPFYPGVPGALCWARDSIKSFDPASGVAHPLFGGCDFSTLVSIAVAPEGRIVAGYDDGSLKTWDARSARILRSFDRSERLASKTDGGVYSLCLTPNGDRLLFSNLKNEVIALDPISGEESVVFRASPGALFDVSFRLSRDGKVILKNDKNSIRIASADGSRTISSFDVSFSYIRTVAISPDGSLAAVGGKPQKGDDGYVELWDARSGTKLRTFKGMYWDPAHATFSDDGMTLAFCDGSAGKFHCFDLREGHDMIAGEDNGYVAALAFAPDGKSILSSNKEHGLSSWDVRTGARLRRYEIPDKEYNRAGVAFSPDGKYLVFGFSDKALMLYRTDSSTPIAKLMSSRDGSKWLTITPDGYWDGSPDCGDLVAMVRGLECWNIDQFAARNNRPDIIAARLGADSDLVDQYRQAWQKRLRRLGLEEGDLSGDYRVPSARIASARQEGRNLELALSFSANGKPLKRYQVFVNGVPLFGSEWKPLSGSAAEATERLELVEGDNRIEVSCMDAGGAESFRAARSFTGPGGRTPDLYFLAFGASAYSDPSINSLRYAAKDARDLEAAFRSMEGKGFSRVITRVYTDAEVTKEAIGRAKDFLAGSRPDDAFVLFISGHGIQLRDPGEAAGASAVSTYYYVTADAKLADIRGTAAEFAAIEGILQGIAPRKKLFLMDTCESGENDEGSIAARLPSSDARGLLARALAPESTRGLLLLPQGTRRATRFDRDRYIYNDLLRRSGAIVFSSCRGDESSLESDAWRQGAFTAKLLEAFRDPAADGDHDGLVSTDELRIYVSAEVPKLVRSVDPGAEQHPTVDRDNIYASFGFPRLD